MLEVPLSTVKVAVRNPEPLDVSQVRWTDISALSGAARLEMLKCGIPTQERLDSFILDQSLGTSLEAYFIIKKTEWRSKNSFHSPLIGGSDNNYTDGFIVKATLDGDHLGFDDNNSCTILAHAPLEHPKGIARVGRRLVVSCSNHIAVLDQQLKTIDVITHPQNQFHDLHDLDVSEDGTKVLTISTRTASVFEVRLDDGVIANSWLPWENGFSSYTIKGVCHQIKEYQGTVEVSFADPLCEGQQILEPAPVSPRQLPFHINGVRYDYDKSWLVTMGLQGKAMRFCNDGRMIQLLCGLTTPHGFQRDPFLGGYQVTNTSAEYSSGKAIEGTVMFFDEELRPRHMLCIHQPQKHHPRGIDANSWLQNMTLIDNASGLYIAIEAASESIYLISMKEKSYRRISYPGNPPASWGWRPHDVVVMDH